MSCPNEEGNRSLTCRIGMLSREIIAAAGRWLAPYDVTPNQAAVFFHILQGVTSPSAIAHSMAVDASNLSRLVATLEKRGLVQRQIDLDNRTRITLNLTAEGRQLAQRIDPHAAEIRQRIVGALSTEEVQVFESCLAKISRAMQPELDPVSWARGPIPASSEGGRDADSAGEPAG